MANWDQLFYDAENCEKAPEAELYRFVSLVEKKFSERPLCLWDLGCGAGRHTVAMAKLGHEAYATDISPKGVELTREWVNNMHLTAKIELADMTECPFKASFHGVFSWNVLSHNTLGNIIKSVDLVYDKLLPGGLFLATIISDKAGLDGKGKGIEPGTFVLDIGKEAGIPHHYFNETGIRQLLDKNKWDIMILVEQVNNYVERPDKFWEYTPFAFTNWGILVSKK